jgi:hypothetical protein
MDVDNENTDTADIPIDLTATSIGSESEVSLHSQSAKAPCISVDNYCALWQLTSAAVKESHAFCATVDLRGGQIYQDVITKLTLDLRTTILHSISTVLVPRAWPS